MALKCSINIVEVSQEIILKEFIEIVHLLLEYTQRKLIWEEKPTFT